MQVPSVRRRKLGEELRKQREKKNLTYDDVVRALDLSKSKMSRIENGHVAVRMTDLRCLLDLYGVDAPTRGRLEALSRQARQRDLPPYMEGVTETFSLFLGMEAEARTVLTFESSHVPGLMQTADYMRSLFSNRRPAYDGEHIEQAISLRQDRQRVLDKDDAPQYWAIVDEAVLRRVVVPVEIIRAQLEHMADMAAERANITLQVIPFHGGTYFAQGSSFSIVRLSDEPGADVAFAQVPLAGGIYLEEVTDLARYTLAFDHLRSVALTDTESIAYVRKVAKDLQ